MGKSGRAVATEEDRGTSVGPSRSERRKAETISAILEAAERRFLQTGFAGTRVEDVAADADVAVGSIYVHFGNKHGLYLALVERAIEVEESYLVQAFDPAQPPLERLVAAGMAYLRFFRDYPGYFRILAFPQFDAPGRQSPHPLVVRLGDMGQRQITRLAETIAEGIADGSLASVDPHRAALFLWGAWQGVMALNLRPERPRVKDRDLEAVLAEGRALVGAGLIVRTAD